jgi:hypothetical protein
MTSSGQKGIPYMMELKIETYRLMLIFVQIIKVAMCQYTDQHLTLTYTNKTKCFQG